MESSHGYMGACLFVISLRSLFNFFCVMATITKNSDFLFID